jgi:hypothetical protein
MAFTEMLQHVLVPGLAELTLIEVGSSFFSLAALRFVGLDRLEQATVGLGL